MGPKKKKNVHVSESVRRPLYLLTNPISQLPNTQLPTNGSILRYYQYLISSKKKRFIKTQINMACKKQKGTRNLVCKSRDFCDLETQSDCLIRQIVNIWTKAGFQAYIISEYSILDKLQALHKKYQLLKKRVTLKDTKDTRENIKNEFISTMEQLFDIGKDNLEQLMRSDKITPRTQAAIEEDLNFYLDQQTDRKWFISKPDKELSTIIEKRLERYKRQEQMRMKYLEEKERCKSAPPPLDESDENLTPTKKRYKSGPANLDMFDSTLTDPDFAVEEDSFEGSDDDYEYSAAHNKTPKVLPKGSMQVNKKITREELMAVTTPICARGLISIELQTWLLSSVVNYLGGDVNQMGISKSSISRERAKVIEHQGNTIRDGIA
ncbi:uncharacterized protein LOC136078669 [Hydra vulgaris]|uniref:Uncharacterized protein LOC136078669 n=2 Tax=Hydra vulgaris TaxID=6087 RepID=A0ABM4BN64_HYDVU